MKKYIVAAGHFLLMNSCLNNDFMEVYPKDQQFPDQNCLDDRSSGIHICRNQIDSRPDRL